MMKKKWDCIASERKIAKCLKFGKFEAVSENRFKFYYFFGTHLPDYNVEKAKESINNVSELMRKISSVSSNSCFIILADHGVKDRSKPIFMCSNGTSEFKTSSIPFSYLNISNVIVQALSGQDIIPPASLKLRQYVFADKNNFRTNLYDSSGDISLPVEYKKVYTGRDRMISGGLEWDMSGKSSTVWTIGHDAYLHLPIMPKLRGKDFYVQIEAMALLGGFRKKQEVEFYLGDSVKKRIIYDSKSRIQNTKLFVTAQESRGQASLQIRFRIKHPTAPRLIIPNSHDPRPLGILLHRIELIELDSEKTILCENLGIEQNKICFISGFANTEPPYGCWNNGFKSVIKTILPEDLKGENIEVTFSCHAFLAGGKIPKQRMKVNSAGKVLIERSFSKEGVESFKVRLPAEVTKEGQVTLDFEFPDCASPKELGMSEDPRKLAVFFRTCEIKAVDDK